MSGTEVAWMYTPGTSPVIAQAYAGLHGYWIGYSAPAQFSQNAPAGIIAPGGRWLARGPADGQPALAMVNDQYQTMCLNADNLGGMQNGHLT